MSNLIQHAEDITQFLKLIANANRLLILYTLQKGETNVTELEQQLGVSQPALSQHLARMRQEGVLETRRSGQQIFYSIRDERVHTLLPVLEGLFR
jgi:ArsR family transcriptional regulator, virulence genes transcriptional regulator